MKKLISLVIQGQENNEIFDPKNILVNRDDCMSSFHSLKARLLKSGVDISTNDINKTYDSKISIFFDPTTEPKIESKINYLVLQESEVINPFGWNKGLYDSFDRVYTWNDDFVDNIKFFKLNFSHLFPSIVEWQEEILDFDEKKLCTLIAGHKKISHPLELYSERINAIKWFEENSNEKEFDFYGMGWDLPIIKNRYLNFIFKKINVSLPFFNGYKRYKGAVVSKKRVLCKYKFSICYENAKSIPGYITEKIFDSFFAGCVPVYYGAPNIDMHIPKECYIDFREFDGYDSLYAYLSNMKKEEYSDYINAIEKFIFSDFSLPYRSETFSRILVEHINNDLS